MADRVQKIIAASGYCSRRKAEVLISEGLVTVNGKKISLGDKAEDGDDVRVEGKRISAPKKMYILLNKPRGYVCTAYDPKGRKTVLDLVADVPERVYSVGRLDYDASGALIMTNDGDFANKIAHPRFECPKRYVVKLRRDLSENDIKKIRSGVLIDGKMVKAELFVLVPNQTEVTVHVGMHKVVKRIFKAVDNFVRKLKRVAIGPVELGDLRTGSWRPLTREEIEYFKSL